MPLPGGGLLRQSKGGCSDAPQAPFFAGRTCAFPDTGFPVNSPTLRSHSGRRCTSKKFAAHAATRSEPIRDDQRDRPSWSARRPAWPAVRAAGTRNLYLGRRARRPSHRSGGRCVGSRSGASRHAFVDRGGELPVRSRLLAVQSSSQCVEYEFRPCRSRTGR